jgi:hypothetical protein
MIYVQGLAGREGYQKLHNVLELNKMENINKDGYEILSKAVDENYQTFSTNFKKKQTKLNFSSASIILF